jgi:hypothetical protein
MFWRAWQKSITPQNIHSGWKKVGLVPFDPEQVLKRFTKIDDERPSSNESSQSILKPEDWKHIEKLLEQTVRNFQDKKAKTLSRTIQSLSTENVLLKLQVQGLENALKIEQKRRQRAKPLQFELRAPEDGMAIFYSPNKVQQARDLQKAKEEAARVAREQKEEDKLRKKQEKAEKRRLIEERKRMRATGREMRLAEQEQKKRQLEENRLAKQANAQLQSDINTAKKGKKKDPTPIAVQEKDEIDDASTVEAIEAPSIVTRLGRAVRLPKHYGD